LSLKFEARTIGTKKGTKANIISHIIFYFAHPKPTKTPQALSQTAAECYNMLASIGHSRTGTRQTGSGNSTLPVLRFLGGGISLFQKKIMKLNQGGSE